MALPGYYYKFKRPDGTEFTYTGAVFEQGVAFSQVSVANCSFGDRADNGEFEYTIYSGGSSQTYNAEPYDLRYYFGSEQFSLIKEIAKSGKTLSQIMNYFVDLATSEDNDNWKTANSATIPELTSKDTGFLLAASGTSYYQIPNVRCSYRSYNKTVTVAGVTITVRIRSFVFYLECNWGTWDSTNQKWNNVASSGQPALWMNLYDHNTAATQEAITSFCTVADKISLAIGAGSSISSNKFVSYNKNMSSYYFYGRNIDEFAVRNLMWRNDITMGSSGKLGSNNWFDGSEVEPEDPWEEPDPYEPVPPGPTPPGPVVPTDPVDPVPEPDYPPLDGTACGIYKVYKPTAGQLQDIASKLWDPNAWDAIKQMFTNPMDAIFGLAIVPVEPITSGSEDVYLGRYNTHVSCLRVSREYVTVDCGSVFINKFYGSYLDHDPYTKFTLYLPYIGELDINADEIMGKTVSVKYHCNVVTGDTVAIVLINNRSCYTAMGNIIRQLPLSQVDFSSVIQTAVSAAATVLTSANSVQSGIASAMIGAATENTGMVLGGVNRASNAASSGIANTLNQVASTKLAYKHAGKIGQGAAQMSVQKPFFTVERPNISLPEGVDQASSSSQKRYTGYPANSVDELRNFHGFTIVEECQLNMLGATDAEIAEATSILKGGVIL